MAIVRAVKSGNWSDTTVWNTGALPTSADDVYSNTFTVTVDISPTIGTVSNASTTGVTAGGSFVLSNGVNLTCTSTLTSWFATNMILFALSTGNTATITANASFTTFLNAQFVIQNTGSGTLNWIGNIGYTSSNSQSRMLTNASGGTINIIGNVFAAGGSGGTPTITVLNASSGTVNITGSVYSAGIGQGGDYSTGCIANYANGVINITGNCSLTHTGFSWRINNFNYSDFIINSGTGSINITGQVSNNTTDFATVNNFSTGGMTIIGTIIAQNSSPAIAQGSNTQNTYLSGPFIGNSSGVVANNAAKWRWTSSVGSSYMTVPNYAGTGYKNLYTADSSSSNSGQPSASNVRSGTVYGPTNELTGTCAVPSAGSVALGVPVDATTGTAVLTTAAVRTAVGMASANLDTQLSSIPSSVWSAGTRTITGGTVDTLTNSPDVPTEAEIAAQVRTELTPELARVANCATVATTGQQIEDALNN